MTRPQISRGVAILTWLVLSAACGDNGVAPPNSTVATIGVSADLTNTAVATLVAEVSAPDITPTLVFNIPISGRTASGSLTVPAGSARLITMRAYDLGGVETDTGSVTITVKNGTNPNVAVVLSPLVGSMPITATLGSYTVAVTPSTLTLALSATDTATLAATVADPGGNHINTSVLWATSDPGIALVDSNGVVMGRNAGSTTVSATARGATARVSVTVNP